MFKPFSLPSTRTRFSAPDVITATIRVKGKNRSQNSSDLNLTSVASEGDHSTQWLQIGMMSDALAIAVTQEQRPDSVRISASGEKPKRSFVVSSQPVCIAIFQHFGEDIPMTPGMSKTLFLKATKVATGLYTLSLIKKETKE